MIRGFFDEHMVAERQFDDVPQTPMGGIGGENKAYRQLRFAKLDVAKAEVPNPADIAALDVVRCVCDSGPSVSGSMSDCERL